MTVSWNAQWYQTFDTLHTEKVLRKHFAIDAMQTSLQIFEYWLFL